MRDLVAGLVALVLLFAAASLAATLQFYRRRRERARQAERASGRSIIAEVPAGDDLALFTEDGDCFYFGDRSADKAAIQAVRVLVNGTPLVACVSARATGLDSRQPTSFEDRPEGIARDRWDVAIEAAGGTLLVECGAIRERVSQELARRIFEAVRQDIERRDAGDRARP